jgi:hypothetical protein
LKVLCLVVVVVVVVVVVIVTTSPLLWSPSNAGLLCQ